MMPVQLLPLVADDRVRGQARTAGGGSPASAGTLAAGSSGSNRAIASSVNRPISAPPGTRFHVVSTPSRMILRGGLAAEQHERTRSSRPPAAAEPPRPKPCVLCMARLRAAIEANDSPEHRIVATDLDLQQRRLARRRRRRLPPPPGRRCGRCAWAATGSARRVAREMRCGSPASLKASTARTADAV